MTWSMPHWRDVVSLLEKRLEPPAFLQEMRGLAEQGYADEQAIELLAGLFGHYLLEMAGLAAALNSAPAEAVGETGRSFRADCRFARSSVARAGLARALTLPFFSQESLSALSQPC